MTYRKRTDQEWVSDNISEMRALLDAVSISMRLSTTHDDAKLHKLRSAMIAFQNAMWELQKDRKGTR